MVRRSLIPVVTWFLLAGCSVTHQPVQLTLRGDGLPHDAQGPPACEKTPA